MPSRIFTIIASICALLVTVFPSTFASEANRLLIDNVQIFDGRNLVSSNGSVRIADGKITEVSVESLTPEAGEQVIDGEGHFLMPGLIDAHVHVSYAFPFSKINEITESYLTATAVSNAKAMLFRGFTTVRDTGGTDAGLVAAINEGYVDGPRILFAGRTLSQTGGHGDFRPVSAVPEPETRFQFGSAIVDGEAQVLQGAREELRRGSHFIKIHAGGGVASPRDPLHSVQFTPDEIEAAVAAASNWGTYVAAHAYTSEAIIQALEAGVMTIEHGNFINEKAARLAARKGAYVVPNLVTYWAMDQTPNLPPYLKEKNKVALASMQDALLILKKHKVNIAFGTDLINQFHPYQNQEFILRSKAFTGLEILRQATSGNAELLGLSGPLNPYGTLGVIEQGAQADLLLVKGNPLQDISVMADPQNNYLMIMKSGKVVK